MEYLTGLEFSACIGPGYFKTMGDLGDYMRALMEDMPGGERRAENLPLPPEWPRDGVYLKTA